MAKGGKESREGELGKTPIPHLFVYAVDRQLTGELFLAASEGVPETVVRFARGVPVKVRAGDGYALLGQLLIEAGAIDDKTLADALATKGLLGDVLLITGRVDRDVLEAAAQRQYLARILRLFEMPPTTKYRYVDGSVELLSWGGEPLNVDPLFLLAAGVRAHGSSALAKTIEALDDTEIRLHPDVPIERFGFDESERLLVEHLAASPSTVPELVSFELAPREAVERLVYLLLIARAVEGSSGVPLGAAPAPVPAPRDSQSGRAVAKMQLKSTVHRSGAAAPDPAGDGERAPVSLRQRKSPDVPSPRFIDAAEAARTAVEIAELHAIAVESTPMSTPEELIPTQPMPRRTGPPAAAVEVEAASAMPAASAAGHPISQAPASLDSALTLESPRPKLPDAVAPTTEALCAVVRERLASRDVAGAVDAATRASRADGSNADASALSAWARSMLQGADVKALSIELDEILSRRDGHVEARFYRGMLRERLGDDDGALRDLRRVLELSPSYEPAARELAALEARKGPLREASLLKRLFKR